MTVPMRGAREEWLERRKELLKRERHRAAPAENVSTDRSNPLSESRPRLETTPSISRRSSGVSSTAVGCTA